MSVSTFFEKLKILNPTADFTDIEKRVYLFGKYGFDLPVNIYHGSYFDLTNVAILRDIVNKRSCAPWIRNNHEVQSFASQALTGVFFHTDVGHASDELEAMAKSEQPKRIHFGNNAALDGCTDSSFYVFKDCLHDEEITRNGAEVTVQSLKVFDGKEEYLLERGKEITTNYGATIYYSKFDPYYNIDEIKRIIASKQPHAYLIKLDFSKCMRNPYGNIHLEDEYLHEIRKEFGDKDHEDFEKLFSIVNIVLFEFSTHTLARIMKENGLGCFSLYESNDGDSSDILYEFMPEPLCDAKYLVTGRGCAFESGHCDDYRDKQTHIIKNAYLLTMSMS